MKNRLSYLVSAVILAALVACGSQNYPAPAEAATAGTVIGQAKFTAYSTHRQAEINSKMPKTGGSIGPIKVLSESSADPFQVQYYEETVFSVGPNGLYIAVPIPVYADNASASAALFVGKVYRTPAGQLMIVYSSGE